VTGAKRRSLQLWADAGVIQPSRDTARAGTGTHRQFSRDEAIVACIIHGFALHQIAIGELLKISEKVRGALAASDERGETIKAAIRGDKSYLLVFQSWKQDIRQIEHDAPTWRTRYAVAAYRTKGAGYVVKLPDILAKPEGFIAIICLATYLSKMDA
jgi:hypothetical protein